MITTRLRVTLRDVVPNVVRVLDVPASSTLPELHSLLQVAIGWTDSHLHQFVTDEATYTVADEDDWAGGGSDDWADEPDAEQDESAARLNDLPAKFCYLYDLGDGWEHDVEVLGPGGDRPGCIYGEGRCPPENCGGPSGYAGLLAVLTDPSHRDHTRLLGWDIDLNEFDTAAADLLVRQTVGEVPASVRLVLDQLAGGVKLTPGGRLPRVVVRAVQEQRPHWYPLDRPASIEEDLKPLSVLHDLLAQVGLTRVRNGTLAPTRAAADDLEVLRRLRSWFEPDAFTTVLIDLAVAVLAVGRPQRTEQLAAAVHPMLGHRWSNNGRRLSQYDVRMALYSVSSELEALDLVDADRGVWEAGPSARTLLPRATGLAARLSMADGSRTGRP